MKSRWTHSIYFATALALSGCGFGWSYVGQPQNGNTPTVGGGDTGTLCRALNPPSGNIIELTPADEATLPTVVANAPSGTVILLDNGIYHLNKANEASRLVFKTDAVTLRSASGDPTSVILDGQYVTNQLIDVQANAVTIAEITLMRANVNLIHVAPPSATNADIKASQFYRLHLYDAGQKFIEVAANAGNSANSDYSKVECSNFELTDQGRPHVQAVGNSPCFTGGIEAHRARGWSVRYNSYRNIYCVNGFASPAIHFWDSSRDTLVEDNLVFNCARGIGFGLGDGTAVTSPRVYADNPYPGVGYLGHIDGIIRDNVVYGNLSSFDTGISLEQARGVKVVQNTSVAGAGATNFFSSLDARYLNTVASTANNLLSLSTTRDSATLFGNRNIIPATLSLFVDAANFDFHLKPSATSAIAQGLDLGSLSGTDPDGNAHALTQPDIGAYNY